MITELETGHLRESRFVNILDEFIRGSDDSLFTKINLDTKTSVLCRSMDESNRRTR